MKLIKDLGLHYATENSPQKTRYGIYECSSCKIHFKAKSYRIERRGTMCKSCKHSISRATHGMSGSNIYQIWNSEQGRCNNVNHSEYKNYGARGIEFCKEFRDFKIWYKYINSLPFANKEGWTIDRINNDGNYEVGNLRWASKITQACNKRKIQVNNTTGYRGIRKSGNRWRANIGVNGKRISLGGYATKKEAAQARDRYVIDNNLPHTLN